MAMARRLFEVTTNSSTSRPRIRSPYVAFVGEAHGRVEQAGGRAQNRLGELVETGGHDQSVAGEFAGEEVGSEFLAATEAGEADAHTGDHGEGEGDGLTDQYDEVVPSQHVAFFVGQHSEQLVIVERLT